MKKVFLLLLALCTVVMAQEWKNRRATFDEENAAAVGVLDFEYATGSNTVASASRAGQAIVGSSATFLTVTNSGITTNAVIDARLAHTTATTAGDKTNNWVTAVTPSDGTFQVYLRQPAGSNAAVRWFIIAY